MDHDTLKFIPSFFQAKLNILFHYNRSFKQDEKQLAAILIILLGAVGVIFNRFCAEEGLKFIPRWSFFPRNVLLARIWSILSGLGLIFVALVMLSQPAD